jgi:hypothetical protein
MHMRFAGIAVWLWASEEAHRKNVPATRQLHLNLDEVRSVDARCCTSIVCTLGKVWITQEANMKDYVLERGQAFRLGGHGLVVAWALTDSELEVQVR